VKLYGYWRSSATWRVRIGLELKQLPYAYVPVNLVRHGGEHKLPEHLARNPLAQVPVLEVRHHGEIAWLSQSLAILGWLDQVHPAYPLLPADAFERARVWQLAEVINAWIQPLQNLSTLKRVSALGGDEAAWAADVIGGGLTALEGMVAGRAGAFLSGAQPGLADCCLVPQLNNARRFGVDLGPMPTLLRIEASCAALPAFRAAHADAQPDAPSQ
jgi:maleylpyruvate isomerase